jgi:hypothetical protein
MVSSIDLSQTDEFNLNGGDAVHSSLMRPPSVAVEHEIFPWRES